MSVDIEQLYRDMVDRLPQFERARKVILAHIEIVERSGGLFTFVPLVDGSHGRLSESVETRCGAAVAKELKKCLREIDEHIQRVRDIPPRKNN